MVASSGLSFPSTSSWTSYSTVSVDVTLEAGENRIVLAATEATGLGNIDSLTITGASVGAIACDGGGGTGGSGTGGDGTGGGSGGSTGEFPFTPSFILGADISWTLEQESGGAVWRDGSQEVPIERILVNHGFNYIRLRTFVCPDCSGGYADVPSYSGFSPTNEAWCDTAHTIEMAQRVKACGLGLFLDFHMSDLWASIGEQHVPSAWAGMSPSEMQAAGYDHVKDVLDQMVAAGVKPDMVQVGNENNSRMSGVSISDWAAYSGLANAGTQAVRDTDPNIIVVAQHGRPRADGNFLPWVDDYVNNNPPIDFDWICGSTYGTTNNGADWIDQFGTVIEDYGVPVLSCEYLDNRRSLINPIMRDFPNNMGKGTFIWEPSTYQYPLFDRNGNNMNANGAMNQYAIIAEDYGLPVPATPASELEGTSCQ
jgi:arabinogalactan endo-1,4-beta-galactosidase